jgi:large subunit ribosomal protein L29
MAKQKLDVTGLNDADLEAKLATLDQEYQQMKFDHSVKGLGNPMELRALRRDVARAQTEVRRRLLATLTPEQVELRSKLRERRRRQK